MKAFSAGPPRLSTLVELLRLRAREASDQLAFKFLTDGEAEEIDLSFGELERRARAIGAALQLRGARGERVLLIYPPGLEFIAAFFGCLYAGAVAIPAYLPGSPRTLLPLQAIIADSGAKFVLTTGTAFARIKARLAQTPMPDGVHWMESDAVADETAELWRAPEIDDSTLAFLQYTSGSTSAPKGVMVSHGNVLHNEWVLQTSWGHDERTRIAAWLPHFHDLGLIANYLHSIYLGVPCVFLSPLAFLQRPMRWLQAISRYGATSSGAPNFAFDACARKVTDEQKATLDLSRWSLAYNGAEPVRASTLRNFADAFAPCGFREEAFYPCYGLAEATLIVSGVGKGRAPVINSYVGGAIETNEVCVASAGAAQTRDMVSCGRVVGGQRVIIVDPETLTERPPKHVGEVWVSSPSVAQGYWQRPELTGQIFRAHLADTGEGPFLRTGDLGFFDAGHLFITGRRKDIIIIRGQNYSPIDIELTAEQSHPAFQPDSGAAFGVEADGDEKVVIVLEVRRVSSPEQREELEASVRQAVNEEHGLQFHDIRLVRPGNIPRTTSGKIQRQACRLRYLSGTLESAPSVAQEDGGSSRNSTTQTIPVA